MPILDATETRFFHNRALRCEFRFLTLCLLVRAHEISAVLRDRKRSNDIYHV